MKINAKSMTIHIRTAKTELSRRKDRKEGQGVALEGDYKNLKLNIYICWKVNNEIHYVREDRSVVIV